jgi:hypothetical protein
MSQVARKLLEQPFQPLHHQARRNNQDDHRGCTETGKEHNLKECRPIRLMLLTTELRIHRTRSGPMPRIMPGSIPRVALEDRVGDRLLLEMLIVLAPHVRLAEHGIGDVQHLRTFFSFCALMLTGVIIRVGITHQMPVRLRDLGPTRGVRDIENLVIVNIRIELATMSGQSDCTSSMNIERLNRSVTSSRILS